jgi:hypothetical protein
VGADPIQYEGGIRDDGDLIDGGMEWPRRYRNTTRLTLRTQ